MIVIIDYGRNNVRSVRHAFVHVGAEAEISSDPHRVRSAAGLVLPGVGSFSSGVGALRTKGLTSAIREAVRQGRALLGICLGMQMLFESSEEGDSGEEGVAEGLCLLPGRMERFKQGQKVPHIGWNRVCDVKPDGLMAGLEGAYMYFVHSYYLPLTWEPGTVAVTEYGVPFVSVMQKANVMGTQFHPEKSGTQGMEVIRRFAEIVESGAM